MYSNVTRIEGEGTLKAPKKTLVTRDRDKFIKYIKFFLIKKIAAYL